MIMCMKLCFIVLQMPHDLTLPLLAMVEALLHDVERPLDAGYGALELAPRVVQLLARRHQPLHFYCYLEIAKYV